MIDSKLDRCLACNEPLVLTEEQVAAVEAEERSFVRQSWADAGQKRVASGVGLIVAGIVLGVISYGISGGRAVSNAALFAVGIGVALIVAGLITSRTGIE